MLRHQVGIFFSLIPVGWGLQLGVDRPRSAALEDGEYRVQHRMNLHDAESDRPAFLGIRRNEIDVRIPLPWDLEKEDYNIGVDFNNKGDVVASAWLEDGEVWRVQQFGDIEGKTWNFTRHHLAGGHLKESLLQQCEDATRQPKYNNRECALRFEKVKNKSIVSLPISVRGRNRDFVRTREAIFRRAMNFLVEFEHRDFLSELETQTESVLGEWNPLDEKAPTGVYDEQVWSEIQAAYRVLFKRIHHKIVRTFYMWGAHSPAERKHEIETKMNEKIEALETILNSKSKQGKTLANEWDTSSLEGPALPNLSGDLTVKEFVTLCTSVLETLRMRIKPSTLEIGSEVSAPVSQKKAGPGAVSFLVVANRAQTIQDKRLLKAFYREKNARIQSSVKHRKAMEGYRAQLANRPKYTSVFF